MTGIKRVFTFDIPCSDQLLSDLDTESLRVYLNNRVNQAIDKWIIEDAEKEYQRGFNGEGTGVPIGIIRTEVKG